MSGSNLVLSRYPKSAIYRFPLSDEGLNTIKSMQELQELLSFRYQEVRKMQNFERFIETYEKRKMNFPYLITEQKFGLTKSQQYHIITARCVICTSCLQYRKKIFSDTCYKLFKICYEHVHVDPDPNDPKIPTLGAAARQKPSKGKTVYLYSTQTANYSRVSINFENISNTDEEIQKCIRMLPETMINSTRKQLICDQFKVTEIDYQRIMKNLRSEHEISLKQLIQSLKDKKCQYRYLPDDLLDRISTQKLGTDTSKHCQIPNVLLVVSPGMKKLFQQFGQYVGFDLTFSLIRQKPQHSKQWLVGVFGGTSQSRKILVYGLVVTNNQSKQTYKYLFQNFFQIMGKSPQTMISDEQFTIRHALLQLKDEGKFKGIHLLDTFHILKKFRKVSEKTTFDMFRKMMHVKDRLEYRKLLKKMLLEVNNDDEVKLLSYFDSNSDKYCYSQIIPTFVGIGISDSMNQKFHDLVKSRIPYETKYIKAVGIILQLIEKRNQIGVASVIEKIPFEDKLSLPFLKQYRLSLSWKMFQLLIKEVCKTFYLSIKEETVSYGKGVKLEKIEHISEQNDDSKSVNSHPQESNYNENFNRILESSQHLQLDASSQIYYQFSQNKFKEAYWKKGLRKEYYKLVQVENWKGTFFVTKPTKQSKWECSCQYELKSGLPCSHILKVLLDNNDNCLDDYIHNRWLINLDNVSDSQVFLKSKHAYSTQVRMRRSALNPRLSPLHSCKKIHKGRTRQKLLTEKQILEEINEQLDESESNSQSKKVNRQKLEQMSSDQDGLKYEDANDEQHSNFYEDFDRSDMISQQAKMEEQDNF